MTREYPFDTEALAKGSRVDASLIESAYNVRRGSDQYRLALLRAKEFVERRLLERGLVVTVACDHFDLAILTDEEAATYNEREFNVGIRKAARSHGRKLAVDRSNLSAPALARHDRSLELQGRQLSAVRRETRLKAAPRERQTPASLPEKD